MKAIVAIDKFWGIGKDGKLLYHNKKDMKFFKKMTNGKVVVMGRKTFESLPNGEPLKNRVNLVITNTEYIDRDNVKFGNMSEIEEEIKKYDTNDVFIIGGASIYKHFLNRCDTIFVTHNIDTYYDADTYMPNLAFEGFTVKRTLYMDSEILISKWITSECNPYKTVLLHEKSNNRARFFYTNNLQYWNGIYTNGTKIISDDDKVELYSLIQNGDKVSIDKFNLYGYHRVELNAESNNDKLRIASFGATESEAYQNLLTSIINLLK